MKSGTFEKGPTDFPLARRARDERMAFSRNGVGSRSEYEMVLLRARFFKDAFTIAEREKPSSAATFCASFFTFGSIFMFKTDVFIYTKVYTK